MTSELMVGFGGKQAWLAVLTSDPSAGPPPEAGESPISAVMAALGLRDLGTVSWRDGIDLAHLTDDRVAVTPPLPGVRDTSWILVVGRRLIRPNAAIDVVGLSEALLTEVQFFATHRVTEMHRWQRALDGKLIRSFGYVGQIGEVTSWSGEPDRAERDAGLPAEFAADTTVLVGENDVLKVAGAWSVDPSTLSGRPAPGPLRLAAAD